MRSSRASSPTTPRASPSGSTRSTTPLRRARAIRRARASSPSAPGGLLGLGLGKSRQKFLFLPEEHNDCIFSIVCEELGLIGATLIMAIFALLIIRGYWIALHARDRFGSLLVVGITTQIALQVFLNIAVVTESCAEHRHLAAVLQLRRHGARHPARGDGRGAEVSRQMPPG